jgi:hypothetical protein
MMEQIEAQADRAADLDVTIHTIAIWDDDKVNDNAWSVLRRLLFDSTWDPDLLDYMATATNGSQYESKNYEADRIRENFETIAQDVHVKLAR